MPSVLSLRNAVAAHASRCSDSLEVRLFHAVLNDSRLRHLYLVPWREGSLPERPWIQVWGIIGFIGPDVIWVFPKIGVFAPKSSICSYGFPFLNHPFWGTPIFGNIHISNDLGNFKIHCFFLGPKHFLNGLILRFPSFEISPIYPVIRRTIDTTIRFDGSTFWICMVLSWYWCDAISIDDIVLLFFCSKYR